MQSRRVVVEPGTPKRHAVGVKPLRAVPEAFRSLAAALAAKRETKTQVEIRAQAPVEPDEPEHCCETLATLDDILDTWGELTDAGRGWWTQQLAQSAYTVFRAGCTHRPHGKKS